MATYNFSYSPKMDVLDRLLADMHMRGASIAEVVLVPDTVLHVPKAPGAIFHLVLSAPGPVNVCCQSEELQLKTGDVVLLPAGSEHRIGQGASTELLSFQEGYGQPVVKGQVSGGAVQLMSAQAHFDEELARPFMTALPTIFRVSGEKGMLAPWVAIGVQFIREELRSNLPAHQAIINRVAEILLIECLRRYLVQIPAESQSWLRALRDPALSRALAAIHRAPGRAWTVASLAGEANLSRSAFAQRFAQCMDQTPMAYLTEHRLRIAAWALRHGSQPVARIAEEVGYSSASAFTQAFDRHKGCSPRAYRDTAAVLPS